MNGTSTESNPIILSGGIVPTAGDSVISFDPFPGVILGTSDTTNLPSSVPATVSAGDYPPGFSVEDTLRFDGSNEVFSPGGKLSCNSPSRSGIHRSIDHPLGTPMPPSYRDILVAHLPVYTDKKSPKDGVSPIGLDRFRDVTIQHKRKGGQGRGLADSLLSVTADSYIPLSVRLVGDLGFQENTNLSAMRKDDETVMTTGALRGLPLDVVKK